MKQHSAEEFKTFAAGELARIYGVTDYERVLLALQENGKLFTETPPEKFGLEYLAARLALACHAWSRGCAENYVEDSKVENLFLKAVMASFQSEKFVSIAQAFSEYLHAPEADKRSVLAVSLMMVKRLGVGQKLLKNGPPPGEAPLKDGQPTLRSDFELLLGVAESFKDDFENTFFDFVFAQP